jgi:signal transduction histidine kinase
MTKILVVEDAHALRKDILEMLTFEGFDVRGAENGLVGVQTAREYMPDLIICDIMMPELDGYGVLAELQKDVSTATLPFIFLTAKTDKMDVRHGMDLGADDYLTKPFTAAELIRTVHARLEKREVITKVAGRRLKNLQDNIILALPHELRTPLTGIMGFSDLLAMDCYTMEADKIAEMAQYIHSAAMRLYRLTENYLVYAQLEVIATDHDRVNSMRQHHTPNPRSIVENEAIQKAQQFGREADLKLEGSGGVSINILEDNLKKIAEELVDNAFKFSTSGKSVLVEEKIQDDQYILTITDHGRGMKLEQITDVGAYMQFDRKWYEQQGSGFGLIISKRLAEIHGGELTIDSKPDEYTRIEVKLPLTPTGAPVHNGA